ncbi:TPA: hypothetical protein EYP66_18110 [Candidatus Poribacteria bacterium]|nr:hypothetical protein [Candidatus Poribacteria bacterium]
MNELQANNGNIAQTARILQMDRANLHRKLRSWNIRREDV